jgi:drug/metabolite transporter (DMT)-like permease
MSQPAASPASDSSLANEWRWSGLAYVALAVILFSTSPVLIRYANPFSAFEITFGRMAVATAMVALLAIATGVSLRFSLADIRKYLVYGLITALHFLLYAASLNFTSITHSLALVYTAPIFVTLFSGLLLKEHLPRTKYFGIVVAVVGVAVLAGFEPAMNPTMALGDVMAIGSALCFGLYSVAGRFERDSYPLPRYAFGLYGFAALWLLPAALLWPHEASSVSMIDWGPLLAIVALGVFPLAIGHTLYNASLRRIHATYVNLVATQEVTGGVLLGLIFLGEMPSVNSAVGAAITLVGVGLVLKK